MGIDYPENFQEIKRKKTARAGFRDSRFRKETAKYLFSWV